MFLANILSAEEDKLKKYWENDFPTLLFKKTKSINMNESSSTKSEEEDIFPFYPFFPYQKAWLNTSCSTNIRDFSNSEKQYTIASLVLGYWQNTCYFCKILKKQKALYALSTVLKVCLLNNDACEKIAILKKMHHLIFLA